MQYENTSLLKKNLFAGGVSQNTYKKTELSSCPTNTRVVQSQQNIKILTVVENSSYYLFLVHCFDNNCFWKLQTPQHDLREKLSVAPWGENTLQI